MLRIRAVIEQIASGTPEHREAAFIAMGPTVVLGAVPLIITMILFAFASHLGLHQLKVLLLDGELLMLTNAIVASSAMLVGKGRRSRARFPGGDFFILIGVILIVASTSCFVSIKIFDLVSYQQVNSILLGLAVLLVFVLGVTYAYYVSLLDEISNAPALDPEREFDEAEDAMKERRAKRLNKQPQPASQESI